jgi:hypothetical protein
MLGEKLLRHRDEEGELKNLAGSSVASNLRMKRRRYTMISPSCHRASR